MIYLWIIIAVCAAEWILRRIVAKKLNLNEKREREGKLIFFSRHHNYGLAGGRLKEKKAAVRNIASVALGVFAVALLLSCLLRGKKMLKTGLALIVGGGLANLLERLHHGYVTDYIQFNVPFERIRRLVFNVADFCIFLGSILLALSGRRREY